MQVALLYATVVLIWGSTWFVITYQLGTVAAEVSVAYRFGLASPSASPCRVHWRISPPAY